MAGSSRFDISSSSPDGSNFTGYANGQRSHFLSSSNLERSSSFRETLESRNLMAGPNLPRGGASSHGEHLPLSQVLLLDTLSMGDQKFIRQVELRRVINAAVGSQTEDPSLGAGHAKALASLGPEELKRVRTFVAENSLKARERARFLNEAISKLDKFRVPLLSRKRSREVSTPSTLSVDRSAVGGNLLKVGSQSHTASNSVDTSSQRSDDRKSAVPNKRLRTSMDTRLEGRSNGLSRPPILTDRERDLFRSGNPASQSEDKDRTLPAGSEGWEKTKLKGRRSGIKSDVSLSTVANRTLDGDRDHKRGIQQRANVDNRSRPSEGHGYRSGPVHGIVSMLKMENSSQQSGLNVRSITRNEHDSTTTNEKKDRFIGLEKDRTVPKSSIKPNIRDENHAASPTTIMKGKASRAPRSSSGASANTSPNFARTSPTFDGWERSSSANRAQVAGGTNNRKRPLPTRSSSPPVAQWGGSKKTQRGRRTNFVAPVSNRDNVTSLAEGSPNPESGAKPDSTESNGTGFPRRSSNNSAPQQSKLKTENVSSSAGLSESEESGAVDNKCKDKNKKQGDAEEKVAPVNQKVGPLVLTKKTKILTKEESGDCVRRQGRSGRGLTPFRTSIPPPSGKLENSATAKQLRSTRPGTDKVESKTGRPPSKKISSDRKPLTRPRRPMNSGSSDFTGESDDDREELLAAANDAINASETACSGPFWKQMEPFFAFLTQDDLDFLKQQIRQLEDADTAAIYTSGNLQNGKAGPICSSLPASPTPIIASKQKSLPNGSVDNEALRLGSLNDTKDMEKSSKKRRWLDKMLPLSQRVLSALIIEEDLKEASRNLYDGQQDDSVQCISEDSPCGTSQIDSDTKDTKRVESEIELEVEWKKRKRHMLDGSRYDSHAASNGHWNYIVENSNGDEFSRGDDIVECSEIENLNSDYGQLDERHMRGRQKNQDESQSDYQSIGLISDISTYEMHSEEMFLDQRILLELHTLGLFPEYVPDLSQREDEEIKEDICKLQEQLQQQVSRNKSQVYKLEKAVLIKQEEEERGREILAFNKLLDIAYKKHMGCRGANASGGKSAGNKAAKQAALAFVKRTLDKCRKFDETGKSCFSEASLKERLFCISSREMDTKLLNDVIEGVTANVFVGSTPPLSDLKPSAVSVTASENSTRAHALKSENGDGELCDTLQAITPYSEQAGVKDELWSTRGKKRELPLEEVVGSGILRGAPALEATLVGGTKGKRSERDREGKGQSKEILTRSGTAKSGRPGLGNAKGERKNKPKPRQKTAQLSATVNGLLGKPAEAPKLSVSDSGEKTSDKLGKPKNDHNPGTTQDISHDNEGAIDLSHLQLPGMEDFVVTDDLGGQGQDLGSWLNFEDEALQDGAGDFMGLDVPMDDLSDLAMMV